MEGQTLLKYFDKKHNLDLSLSADNVSKKTISHLQVNFRRDPAVVSAIK